MANHVFKPTHPYLMYDMLKGMGTFLLVFVDPLLVTAFWGTNTMLGFAKEDPAVYVPARALGHGRVDSDSDLGIP